MPAEGLGGSGSGNCRGGLVSEAHRLLYHSAFKAQGPSRTCNESKEEEELAVGVVEHSRHAGGGVRRQRLGELPVVVQS